MVYGENYFIKANFNTSSACGIKDLLLCPIVRYYFLSVNLQQRRPLYIAGIFTAAYMENFVNSITLLPASVVRSVTVGGPGYSRQCTRINSDIMAYHKQFF